MQSELIFRLNKDNLLDLRKTIELAINIAKEMDEIIKKLPSDLQVTMVAFEENNPLENYFEVNGEQTKVVIVPIADINANKYQCQ